MPPPRGSTGRRLAAILVPIVLAGAACRWDDASGPECARDAVAAVGLTLGFPGYVSDAFLTVGDRDTVRAQAYTRGWPSYVKYDSHGEPRRFVYSSSDPQVATVDADGIVVTARPGTTMLRAATAGAVSLPMALTVAPPAVELRATPLMLQAELGDVLAIAVSAVDEHGADVAGVIFDVVPDTTVWTVVSRPAEGSWRLETPRILHVRASRAGTVRLLAYSQNERAAARLQANPVLITVRSP
jgi:hypothetical protein